MRICRTCGKKYNGSKYSKKCVNCYIVPNRSQAEKRRKINKMKELKKKVRYNTKPLNLSLMSKPLKKIKKRKKKFRISTIKEWEAREEEIKEKVLTNWKGQNEFVNWLSKKEKKC